MKPVLYPNVAALMESTGKGEWDITFLPITPERAGVGSARGEIARERRSYPLG